MQVKSPGAYYSAYIEYEKHGKDFLMKIDWSLATAQSCLGLTTESTEEFTIIIGS